MGVPEATTVRTVTTNSNSVSFSLRQRIQLSWMHVSYASDATVGDRQIELVLKDESGNVLADWISQDTQAASLTRHYSFQGGVYRESTFVSGEIQIAIPNILIIEPNWSLTIEDGSAVPVSAGDDITYAYQGVVG